ncbi:unnamed protein product [Rotaria sordida]|uniref:C3H1-type domain-containing protein n=1 Tax=Rotaria sordida TaxID=392033 RepID=A0A815VZY2_9BILA|nr:unnamed protein product [Rotaria sordida]CAF1538673.1 unnamed protein product [Rotaria sordida]
MANAHSPGGGYRKGDGAQEENLFRRSDYFRSLDIGLDQWLPERSERFQCLSSGKLERLIDPATMYSMHEFEARASSPARVPHKGDKRTPCKRGNKCRKMGDAQHCAQYSHQADDQPAKFPCKYGAGCYNLKSDHRAEYSHPSDGERKS